MSDCRYSVKLKARLDGELSAPVSAEVDRHLADCSACRGELEELRAVTEWVQSAPVAAPARPRAGAILATVKARRADLERTVRFAQSVAAVAAVLLLSTVIVLATGEQGPSVHELSTYAPPASDTGMESSEVDPEYAYYDGADTRLDIPLVLVPEEE